MTKVVIVGDMTFGEERPPGRPSYPGSPDRPEVSPPIELPPGIDAGLPPIPGQGLPPPDLGPGEIWPPLKPGEPKPKKAYAIVAIPGVGYRYTVVDLSLRPDQGLPSEPPRPGHPLPEPEPEPPTAQPKRK